MKVFKSYEDYILDTKTTEDVIVMDDDGHADADIKETSYYGGKVSYYSHLNSCAYNCEDIAVYFTECSDTYTWSGIVEALKWLYDNGYSVDDILIDVVVNDALVTICTWADDTRKNEFHVDSWIAHYDLPDNIHKEIVELIIEDQEDNETTRKTWYIFDSESAIINEGEGIEDRYDAIDDFRNRFSEDEAREYGFTLCLVEEENGCWELCLEELTADDIY